MTAAPERTDKYQVIDRPASGARFWLLAPVGHKGWPDGADLHLSVERAEEIALLLMEKVDAAREAERLQSEDE